MTSYRESHIGDGKGTWYDEAHARKFDAVVWDHLIKPQLAVELQRCVAGGATRYLDFACGTGRVLKFGSRYFADATGLDISADMLAVARERVPAARLFRLDVTRESVPAEVGQFDVVTLFRFLLNAEPALRLEVMQWLSQHMPSGAVLIGNNHMETRSISGLVTVAANATINRRRNHLSRGEIESLFESTGFRVERWYGYRVLPTIMGKPILGSALQLAIEKIAVSMGVGRFGVEHLFVARRL